jgi:hypothetical protein
VQRGNQPHGDQDRLTARPSSGQAARSARSWRRAGSPHPAVRACNCATSLRRLGRSPSRGGLGGLLQAPVAASAHTLWEGSPWSSRRLVGLEQCRQGWGSKHQCAEELQSSRPLATGSSSARPPPVRWRAFPCPALSAKGRARRTGGGEHRPAVGLEVVAGLTPQPSGVVPIAGTAGLFEILEDQ